MLAFTGFEMAVIPAGEQWRDSALRPCLEDLMGAGSVLACSVLACSVLACGGGKAAAAAAITDRAVGAAECTGGATGSGAADAT